MINTKNGARCVFMAAMLAAILACIMIISCEAVYADDQAPEAAQPQAEVTVPEVLQPQTEVTVTEASQPQTGDAPAAEEVTADSQEPQLLTAAEPQAVAEEATAASQEPELLTAAEPQAAAEDMAPSESPEEDAEEPEEESYDITKQSISNLRYDENSGMLSWDPVSAPSDVTIKYSIYLKADNIKSSTYSIASGAKSLVLSTTDTYVNIDNNRDFADRFTDYEGADYTFYVKATDGTRDSNNFVRFSSEAASPVYSMSHYKLQVLAYTKTYTYNKTKGDFSESVRRATLSQGGEILLDGKSLNNSNGIYVYSESKAIRSGKTVFLEYVPLPGYRFYSEKVDDGTNDRNAAATRTLVMDKAYRIVIYFEQPFAEVITSGYEASSDNLEDIAIITLAEDAAAAGMKSGVEGYMQMRVDTVSSDSLSAADRNICDNDSALKSKKIRRGSFLEISFYKSLDLAAPSKFDKTPKPVNLKLMIPDYLKNSDASIRRTFYLIRVDNGEATIISDGTGDALSGYITDSGLYMIGFKDTDLEGILSGSTRGNDSYEYAAAAEPAQEPGINAPEILAEPPMFFPPELFEAGAGFPIAAVAAASAATIGGAVGIRYLLIALAILRPKV